MAYIGNAPGLATRQLFRYVATSGQTSFAGADANSLTLNYTPGLLDVYVDGKLIPAIDYTATNGSTVVFNTGLSLGMDVVINAFGAFSPANTFARDQNLNDLVSPSAARTALGLADPSTDDKHYTRRNGVWVLRSETVPVNGTNIYIFTRPSWASNAFVRGKVYGDGGDTTNILQLRNAGSPLSTNGYYFYGSYNNYTDASLTQYVQNAQTYVNVTNSFGAQFSLTTFEVLVSLTRPSTTHSFGGSIRSLAWPAAGNHYSMVGSWNFSSGGVTALAVDSFSISKGSGNWDNGSTITVEWN